MLSVRWQTAWQRLNVWLPDSWHIFAPLMFWLVFVGIICFLSPYELYKDEVFWYLPCVDYKSYGLIPSLDDLRSFYMHTPPLYYWVGGLLLRIYESIVVIRIFNSLLTLCSLLFFANALQRLLGDKRTAFFLFLLYALNPYLYLVTTHVYTDAMYLLTVHVAAFCVAVNRKNFLYYAAMFCSPLIRQFGMFLGTGSFMSEAQRWIEVRDKKSFRRIVYSFASLLGIGFFFLLWRDTTAPNNFMLEILKPMYAKYGRIHPYICAYHLSAMGFYLLPLFLLMAVRQYRERRFWISGALGMAFYLCFPVHQNFYYTFFPSDNVTCGYYHKLALWTFGDPFFHIVLATTAFLATASIASLFTTSVFLEYRWWIGLFFAVSFFNYAAWDKYLLDTIPIVLLATAQLFDTEKSAALLDNLSLHDATLPKTVAQ